MSSVASNNSHNKRAKSAGITLNGWRDDVGTKFMMTPEKSFFEFFFCHQSRHSDSSKGIDVITRHH